MFQILKDLSLALINKIKSTPALVFTWKELRQSVAGRQAGTLHNKPWVGLSKPDPIVHVRKWSLSSKRTAFFFSFAPHTKTSFLFLIKQKEDWKGEEVVEDFAWN